MDWQTFLVDSLENVVASLPQLIAVVTMVYYSLKKIDKNTSSFSPMLKNAQDILKTAFGSSEKHLVQSFNEAKNMLVTSFEETSKHMKEIMEEAVDEMQEQVNDSLAAMKKELSGYQSQLKSMKQQTNLVAKENKAYMNVISILLAEDPEKIKNGVAALVSNQLNMTQEELEALPEQIVENWPLLKEVLKDVAETLGEKNLDVLLGEIGYERKEK